MTWNVSETRERMLRRSARALGLRRKDGLVGETADVGVVERGVDLVEDEEGRGREAVDGEEQRERSNAWSSQPRLITASDGLFSPPDRASISRKRFIGGMAWYLMPAR